MVTFLALDLIPDLLGVTFNAEKGTRSQKQKKFLAGNHLPGPTIKPGVPR